MTFLVGCDYLDRIVEKIAEQLISTGKWSDADSTWTTENFNSAKRVVKHIEGVYVAIELLNSAQTVASSRYAKGLRITFSQTWDTVNHSYPVDRMQTFVQFCCDDSSSDLPDLRYQRVDYYMWVEENGFVIMGRPASCGCYHGAFIICVERNPNKEYDDHYTNFYCYNRTNWCNYDEYDGRRTKNVIRPFNYQANGRYSGYQKVMSPILSEADGKAYGVFGLIHNAEDNRDPIFQPTFFIEWDEGMGVIPGDILKVEGSTREYLVLELTGSSAGDKLRYAIKIHD